jgi:hypothetical protein
MPWRGIRSGGIAPPFLTSALGSVVNWNTDTCDPKTCWYRRIYVLRLKYFPYAMYGKVKTWYWFGWLTSECFCGSDIFLFIMQAVVSTPLNLNLWNINFAIELPCVDVHIEIRHKRSLRRTVERTSVTSAPTQNCSAPYLTPACIPWLAISRILWQTKKLFSY